MASEVTAYRANDGSLHDTECEAAARDLQLIIAGSKCAENSPYAKTMLEWMIRNPREIADALTAYADACPQEPPEESDPGNGETVS